MTLQVRLGDGFNNHTVSVKVDGIEVLRKAGVSTDLRLSSAASLAIQTEAASVQLEVAVEGGPHAVLTVAPGQTPFVEVHLVDGVLQLTPRDKATPLM